MTMATFLEKLRERNKNRKDMDTPRVTNPKVPTKVERDVAAFTARQKPMPNFKFGTGTMLEKMKARTAERKDNGLTYADPAFTPTNSWEALGVDVDTFDAELEKFAAEVKAKKISLGNP